jgi:hypothetical protein
MTCGARLALREREEEIERASDGLEPTESGGCGTLESRCRDREPRRWVQRNPEPKNGSGVTHVGEADRCVGGRASRPAR